MCAREEYLYGSERSRMGQREKSRRGAVATEASADAMGSPGAGVVLESCPRLRQRSQTFVPPLSSHCMWAPREGVAALTRQLSAEGKCLKQDSAVNLSS